MHQSPELPCRVSLRQHQRRNTLFWSNRWWKYAFLIWLPDFIELSVFIMVLLIGVALFFFLNLILWALLYVMLYRTEKEQCQINHQTCLSADPQFSCYSSLVAHWVFPCYFVAIFIYSKVAEYTELTLALLLHIKQIGMHWFTPAADLTLIVSVYSPFNLFPGEEGSDLELTAPLRSKLWNRRNIPWDQTIKSDSSSDLLMELD